MSRVFTAHDGRSIKEYLIRKLPLIMAFLIPVLILLVIYIGRGIFPFGTNMYLRSDMYHQYAPFMKEFQRNIQNGGSLLYAWNIGLGTNFASTYAYYLASPVNWLAALFPASVIPEFMNLMLILKAGLMSAFFAWYLIRKYKRNDYISTAFGCFYAMSSYMAAFSWNVMWLDCLVLFPLILSGLEALVRDGKRRMYIITLALCIISNYYISIMICIFLVFYFIYLLVCESADYSAERILQRSCVFVLASVAAGCMAMFIVLPALYHLFITASSNSAFPGKMTAYYNLLEMLSKAVINTEPAVFSGHFPNIYSTMALFFLVPLYWISHRIPARERAGKTLLISLLAFSFMFNIPTYIWHGFHFPNSLPCRYSFIYIFLTLQMGYQALLVIRRFRAREIVLCAAAGLGGIFILQTLYESDSFTVGTACAGAAFVLLYLVIAILLKHRRTSKVLTMILLLAVSIAEIVINTNTTGYSITSRTTYYSDNAAIAQMLSEAEDGTFYRVEKVKRRTKNDGTWNDYNSASIFSSTTVAGNSDLYSALGMQGRTNAYSYYGHTPVTQALLGVRYEIAGDEQTDPLMTLASQSGDYYLYENKYALSLGFMVDPALEETPVRASEPFLYQNELLANACGVEDVFEILPSTGGDKCIFTAPSDGRCLIYITADIDSATVQITHDEEITVTKKMDSLETPQIIDAGDVQAGDEVMVISEDDDVTSMTVYPAIMDYDKYEQAMTALEREQLQITRFEDTRVEGTVNTEHGGILFTTIPYDPGWAVTVDGERVNYRDFEESFLMLDLDPGVHTVVLTYWPMGLTAGIIISLIALAAFLATEVLMNMKRRSIAANPLK